jgi:hypothetical protein
MLSFLVSTGAAGAASSWAPGSSWKQDAFGSTAIFHMKTAPFPHPKKPYTDDRVMFFVPEGFRPGASVDFIIHYHGHNSEIVRSEAAHHYREQLWLSKKNAILLEPQGPENAKDGAGGKHEDPQGLKSFVDEALSILAQEKAIPQGAALRQLVLSGHSGAYHVIAMALVNGGLGPYVNEVHLQDALYGHSDIFESWVKQPGHKLVSSFTRLAGTVTNNEALEAKLRTLGLAVSELDDDESLAKAQAIFIRADQTHGDVTHGRNRWAEILERSCLSDLGVPRAVMRSVTAAASGGVQVSWYPLRSSLLKGYKLYSSADGQSWKLEKTLPPGTTSAVVSGTSERLYKVAAVDDRGQEGGASNVYAASPQKSRTRVLVVDGFCRTTGHFTEPAHPFGALVGHSVGASGRAYDCASWRAVRDGSVVISHYPSVVWLSGDQSTFDAALDGTEEKVLSAYLEGGGTLLISGSEIGFDLSRADGSPADGAFYSGMLHAKLVGDAAKSHEASGVAGGPLEGVTLGFGGTGAPYTVPSPDFMTPQAGAQLALRYGDGNGAGVAYEGVFGKGTAHSGVLYFGFPVEAIDTGAQRDAFLAKALDWLDGVARR